MFSYIKRKIDISPYRVHILAGPVLLVYMYAYVSVVFDVLNDETHRSLMEFSSETYEIVN